LKIGIYSELFARAALGGRELIVAVLGEAFTARGHRVEYVHHVPELSAADFEERFATAPGSIALRYVPNHSRAGVRNFLQWLREHRRWEESLSSGYDCFICIVHDVPIRCHSPRAVLQVLFPIFQPYDLAGMSRLTGGGLWRLRGALRTLYMRQRWQRALATYPLRTSISRYTQLWTKLRWRTDSTVIYPPSGGSFAPAEKRDLILSVGRFSGYPIGTVSKRQLEMTKAFSEMETPWEYASIGAVGKSGCDRDYFARVQGVAEEGGDRIEIIADAPHATLKQLYGAAKIFWHAAGYGDDDRAHPELMEHFGIATVDAMSAGAVPVVINKGAQPEIVEHGVSGFLWNTLDELKSYTITLMRDEQLRLRMAAAAEQRAAHFSRDAFVERFFEFVEPMLNKPL
jgi:glycosyltransferase involved in cell wall biosynthesis